MECKNRLPLCTSEVNFSFAILFAPGIRPFSFYLSPIHPPFPRLRRINVQMLKFNHLECAKGTSYYWSLNVIYWM